MSKTLSILDANPLEHLSSDIAISQYNYESIMNGLVEWQSSKMETVTVRLATNTDPYFVDYVLLTKHAYDSGSGNVASSVALTPGSFSFNEKVKVSAMHDPDSSASDTIKVRINTINNGDTTWRLYGNAIIYNETLMDENGELYLDNNTFKHTYVKDIYFKRSTVVDGVPYITLYRTITDVAKGDAIEVGTNCEQVVVDYEDVKLPTEHVIDGTQLVRYNGKLYVADGSITPYMTPDSDRSGYKVYCDEYTEGNRYEYGTMLYYRGEMFVAVTDNALGLPPVSIEYDEDLEANVLEYNGKYWTACFLVDTYAEVTGSGNYSVNAVTDFDGFILRNVGENESSAQTEIKLTTSLQIKGKTSTPNSGVAVMGTTNFSRWPMTSPKWKPNKSYSTDTTKNVYSLQEYSATMVFNHADADVKKMNILNYDGPDLDQGLCIFLPVDVLMDDGSVSSPEDGYMFEFLIRIWPDPAYNDRTVNDLIINKSQVYFYNISDYTEFDWSNRDFDSSNVKPIAKFSMARLTNFYVFSENIGVPDRPVVYKARFIYSESEHMWRTYDYYQLPDHVFMSPTGFVDPMAGDDAHIGVETGGFPLFQDPFAGTDLTPIRVTEDYTARILEK